MCQFEKLYSYLKSLYNVAEGFFNFNDYFNVDEKNPEYIWSNSVEHIQIKFARIINDISLINKEDKDLIIDKIIKKGNNINPNLYPEVDFEETNEYEEEEDENGDEMEEEVKDEPNSTIENPPSEEIQKTSVARKTTHTEETQRNESESEAESEG